MAETLTTNYGWTKPDIGGDSTVWGNVLNTTFDAIDSVAWANQQAGVPIGAITMFGGATPPTNWMLCDGAVYLNTDVPALVPILGTQFPGSDSTHTAVPDLRGRFPIGRDGISWTRGLMGGEASHTLIAAELAAHTHTATQAAHGHTATQGTHAHQIIDMTHSHGVSQTPHGHADAGHVHGISDPGHVHDTAWFVSGQFGVGNFSPNNVTRGVAGNNTSVANTGITQTNAAAANIQTANANISLGYSGTGLSATQAASAGAITVTTSQPAITVAASTGGDAAHNNMPPYTCVGFIIKYQ